MTYHIEQCHVHNIALGFRGKLNNGFTITQTEKLLHRLLKQYTSAQPEPPKFKAAVIERLTRIENEINKLALTEEQDNRN